MKDMGYVEGTPAAICDVALQTLKVMFFRKYGEKLNDEQALHVAGIQVKGSDSSDNHVSLQSYVHKFRHQDNPSRVSEGLVHHGWVRKQVEKVLPCGKIVYSKKDHPLQSLYFNVEVVTGTMISMAWDNILDVGTLDDFRKGTKREIKEFSELKEKVISQELAEKLLEFGNISQDKLQGDAWDELTAWCRKLLYTHTKLNKEAINKIPITIRNITGIEGYILNNLEEYV